LNLRPPALPAALAFLERRMLIVAAIVLACWIATLAITITNLALLRRLPAATATIGPRVSIIVPARNEERAIERSARSLLAQHWEDLEVIVVNDRSTDATGAILEKLAAEDSRLKVVHGVEPGPGWLGKPWALQQGYEHSTGELLLFVDADIHYAPATAAALVSRLEVSGAAMVSALPRFEMRGFWENALMPMLAMTIFSFIPTFLSNRSLRPWLGIGGGPGNLVRRRAYEEAGTHMALKDAIVDDVGLARLIRQSGHRTEVALADHLVSLRMYHGFREVVDGFTKNAFSAMGRSYGLTLVSVVGTLIFHLLPYLGALAGEPISIATVAVITITRLILFASLGYPLGSAIFLHPVMTAGWSCIFLRSMWITGIRRQLMWRGRRYDSPAGRFGPDR
jgi:chlorobactene glucosyltransferase